MAIYEFRFNWKCFSLTLLQFTHRGFKLKIPISRRQRIVEYLVEDFPRNGERGLYGGRLYKNVTTLIA